MMPRAVEETRARDADPFSEAVAALYHAHFASLFRYLDRLTGDPDMAKDFAQDTFVRLHRRGALPDDPRAWLATVATNLVRDHQRQARRRAELVVQFASDAAQPSETPAADAMMLVREARSQVRSALDALPERDRMLLLLRHEGYSYRELAHAVGVAEGSVGTLLIRATRVFRNAVGAESLAVREGYHASH
ncbi:MAG TPA: sigma-70 family RNA polymerase sigma factor [Gemmatimonadaceae bacterium]|jgi:RNA polymerase sigma factor (sigma-70 family)|nr:sigma-70 family RNA polymerase sigma factor [Gemmatimonadaceae bacterium]